MAARSKMPPLVLVALTAGPALAIGMTLWLVNDLVPACEITELQRQTSPDGQFDLVVFSRSCGDTPPNSQAALVPPAEEVAFDAASFVSIASATAIDGRWDGYGNIEVILPENADIFRQDESVAGVSVIYR